MPTTTLRPKPYFSSYRTRAGRTFVLHAWATAPEFLPKRVRASRRHLVWVTESFMRKHLVPPSRWAAKKDWPRTMHALMWMHHWSFLLADPRHFVAPMEEGRPLHEVAHRLVEAKPSISDAGLVKMIRQEERSLRGFVKQNPFGGED